MPHHKRQAQHSKHNFSGKNFQDKHQNKQQFFQPVANANLVNLKKSPELQNDFFNKALRYWSSLSPAQKAAVCIIGGAVASCSAYVIFQMMMTKVTLTSNIFPRREFDISKAPSNQLNATELKAAKQRIRAITAIDPNIVAKAQTFPDKKSSQRFLNELDSYKEFVLHALSDAIIPKTHKDALDQPDLKIHITHKGGANGGKAGYDGVTHEVLFTEPRVMDKDDVTSSYCNEMFNVQVHHRNKQLRCPMTGKLLDAEPFCLDGSWEHKVELAANLEKAMNDGLNKLNTLHSISQKIVNGRAISSSDQLFYDQAAPVVNDYLATGETITVSRHDFNKDFVPHLINADVINGYSKMIPRNIMQQRYTYPIHTNMYVIILAEKPNEVTLKYQFGSDGTIPNKISSLTTLLNVQKSIVYGTESKYAPKGEPPEYLTSEMASFVNCLSSPIKAEFFSEFCDYFSQYFEVDYCDSHRPKI